MSEYAREPRSYELMVILLPELVDEELTGTIDRVTGYVNQIGADVREVLKDSPWGRRRLAYTVRFNGTDYRDGYYVIWHFTASPSSLSDLERELKLDTRVIRHLLVIEDPKWGSPQEREAARELANAPAVPEATAAVAPAQDTVAKSPADVAVTEAPEDAEGAAETAVVEQAVEVVEATDNAAEPAEVEPANETVESADVVEEEAAAVDETAEVAEVDTAAVDDAAEVIETVPATEDEK